MSLVAQKIRNHIDTETDEASFWLSWTAHHIDMTRDKSEHTKTLITTLPVIDHLADDFDFQMHILKTNRCFTNYLNPGQTSVSCSDQPLYAKKKMLMWALPSLFSKKTLFQG